MSDYFDLYCRGPLEMRGPGGKADRALEIHFRRNSSESGERGQKLQPGTAAFGDRPVDASEPDVVRVRFPTGEPSWRLQPPSSDLGSLFGNEQPSPPRYIPYGG